MKSKKQYLASVVNKKNRRFPITAFGIEECNIEEIINRLKLNVVKELGEEYQQLVHPSRITLDSDYDSSNVNAHIVITELDKDRDERIKKETAQGLLSYANALTDHEQKVIKENAASYELYLSLKKKFGNKIKS